MTICDRCGKPVSEEALGLGWPVADQDNEWICPECYGDEAYCGEGHLLPAQDGDACATCRDAEIASLCALLRGAVSTSHDHDTGEYWIWAGDLAGEQVPGDGTRECEELLWLGVLAPDVDPDGEYRLYLVRDVDALRTHRLIV